MPTVTKRKPGPHKYAWDVWFALLASHGEFVLQRGVDYEISQGTMCQIIRNNAAHRKVPVTVRDLHDKIYVKVRDANVTE